VFVHRIRFPGQPLFNEAALADVIGKTVMVGITTTDRNRSVVGYEEFRGRIVRANREEGVVIQTPPGTLRRLPPDLIAFLIPKRGGYRSRTTGDVIWDPDLIATWTYTPPS
jgi:hypothetical protein